MFSLFVFSLTVRFMTKCFDTDEKITSFFYYFFLFCDYDGSREYWRDSLVCFFVDLCIVSHFCWFSNFGLAINVSGNRLRNINDQTKQGKKQSKTHDYRNNEQKKKHTHSQILQMPKMKLKMFCCCYFLPLI